MSTLIYNANCGFTVSAETSNCIFDTLFRVPREAEYNGPDDTLISDILEGIEPYDRPNVLVITHAHWDHFDLGLTLDFLRARQSNHVICPLSIRDQINGDFASQITTSTGAGRDGRHEVFTFGDLSIKAIATDHCGPPGNPDTSIEHSSYVLTAGAASVFHAGDLHPSSQQIAGLGLSDERFDVAILPHWFLDDYGLSIIQDHIDAELLAISHSGI